MIPLTTELNNLLTGYLITQNPVNQDPVTQQQTTDIVMLALQSLEKRIKKIEQNLLINLTGALG